MHHILSGLDGKKMSKSDPDNAIFMDDAEAEINRKVKKAFCPEGQVDGNPIVEYVRYIIFEITGKFEVGRAEKYGGNLKFELFEDFKKSFENKEVHPADVKTAVARYLNMYLTPIRESMNSNTEVVKLMKKVKK